MYIVCHIDCKLELHGADFAMIKGITESHGIGKGAVSTWDCYTTSRNNDHRQMLFLIGWKRALSYFTLLIFKMCTVLKRIILCRLHFLWKLTWRSNADGFILALSCYIRMYRKRIKYIDYLNLLLIWKDETS